ncbi:MAG: aspartate aminotransferase family protein [Gemmataceae bacterium]|jgi:4-aminobutyrate aminotransferase-like enzyme
MIKSIHHPGENSSNEIRNQLVNIEPKSLRTFTPSQAILAKSAGSFHWTPEGRKLYDFTSGVLVANLGHNPVRWTKRFFELMGWSNLGGANDSDGYFSAVTMTAYNAATPIEIQASEKLLALMRVHPVGSRMQQVLWAASGSEGIQKALWAAMAKDKNRDMIIATRYGFHGKKGLSNAITGTENDKERDPRVKFISFPMCECNDLSMRDNPFDFSHYQKELDALWHQYGRKLGTLITEPYLGGGGSYHPPKEYLQMLVRFCREKDIVFILDEVQANFGRTSQNFAYENYGIEPDIVVLGKGLGNGVPVAAVVGRKDLFDCLDYGEASDTWSANPLCCAAVIATLEEFENGKVLEHSRKVSAIIEEGLIALKKDLPFVANVRGEKGGMVWGVEMADWAGKNSHAWACAMVEACYRGDINGDGIHILGPLARKVVRISPPLTLSLAEAAASMKLLHKLLAPLVEHNVDHGAAIIASVAGGL